MRHGYGGGHHKQVRYLQVTTDDGAAPIWDQAWDGATTDVATVIATMHALCEPAHCTDFVLVGDSKLLSAANRQAVPRAGVGYPAPVPRTPDLAAAFLAIPSEQLVALDSVSPREATQPPEEPTTYHGFAHPITVGAPTGDGGERGQELQRVFVVSSADRAACRRNRARQRERAEAERARIVGRVGSRWYPTAERAQAKIAAILEPRHLTGLYRVQWGEQDGRPTVRCELVGAALARAEALDGHHVLETTRPAAAAAARALLAEWNGQWQIEQRHRGAKGPLRIRPLCVTSNQRIVGSITILGIALLVFSLTEREARRTPGAGVKRPGLLAGQVAARPTGENLLKVLQESALVQVVIAGARHRRVAALSPLQQRVLALLHVPATVHARLTT